MRKLLKTVTNVFLSSPPVLPLILFLYVLICFVSGINRNRYSLLFTLFFSCVLFFINSRVSVKLVIFILSVFVLTNTVVPPNVDITMEVLNRKLPGLRYYRTISGTKGNKYEFLFPDIGENNNPQHAELIVEGKWLENNLLYGCEGFEISGVPQFINTSILDDQKMIGKIKLLGRNAVLNLTAKPGAAFSLFQGPETCKRRIYPDAVYIIRENEKERVIYYPELKQ